MRQHPLDKVRVVSLATPLHGDRFAYSEDASVREDQLKHFDDSPRRGVEHALWDGMSDLAWLQATMGVWARGLGFREASVVAGEDPKSWNIAPSQL